MSKLKLGIYWAAACGGCDTKILDVNEKILDIAAVADILFWPIALDFKYKDVEAMPDRHMHICIISGAVRNSEQEHIVKLLRKKSKAVVALGACAISGGIPGLANAFSAEEILDRAYSTTPSTVNPENIRPQTKTEVAEGTLTLPKFYDSVFAIDDIVPVEYYIPGCPPNPDLIMAAVNAIVTGTLPPPGATIAGEKSLCEECPRERTEEKQVTRWKRISDEAPEPDRCLLEQGFLCMGPATRSGCGALCIKANIPCEGCFGPIEGVVDQGAKMMSAMASISTAKEPDEVANMAKQIVDPVGYFYRFGLPKSLLKGRR